MPFRDRDNSEDLMESETVFQMEDIENSKDLNLKLIKEGKDKVPTIILDKDLNSYHLIPSNDFRDLIIELSDSKRELLTLILRNIIEKENPIDVEDVLAVTISRLRKSYIPTDLASLEEKLVEVVKSIKKDNANLFHKELNVNNLLKNINI